MFTIELEYKNTCPYKIGDIIESPVHDSRTRYEFEGSGTVREIFLTEIYPGIDLYRVIVMIEDWREW